MSSETSAGADDPTTRPSVILLPGRDRRAAGGHPWIYSNEIRMDTAAKALAPGALVTVRRADESALGVAIFNPHTLIAARLLDRDAARPIGRRFFLRRLERAMRLRERLFDAPYYRLVHAEADGLPGLVVDRFGAVLVVQSNTAGMARLEPLVLDVLAQLLNPDAVVLRNDSPMRALEGLQSETRLARGTLDGPVLVNENGAVFSADLLRGQKTGWFYDQRDNRRLIAALARDARVLDLYCFTGGFAVQVARGGAAAVLGIDSSEPALTLAVEAAELNGVTQICTFRRGEAFAETARLAAARERFDIVIADPPAFAKSRKEVPAALRGYRKLARLASAVTAPGGVLFLASCSFNVGAEEFADAVRRGLADAGRAGRILRVAGSDADHPIHPALPETGYLKTLTIALD
ncbi:MAG TPA: class I SAM-dependent rRNA methyltransferase [Stellaceae bacterium]|nr:class I SAM-dependent rRNA methyltransferase [Stellaceae bacterium]